MPFIFTPFILNVLVPLLVLYVLLTIGAEFFPIYRPAAFASIFFLHVLQCIFLMAFVLFFPF
jgi:hypothetical protein